MPCQLALFCSVVVGSDIVLEQPPEMATLLSEFESVFAPPTGYPVARHCDHAIPLIPGASPVIVRP